MSVQGWALLAAVGAAILLATPAVPLAATSHYLPNAGDEFHYSETLQLTNGVGNYTGYSEDSLYTGSISVTSVFPNGTTAASYQSNGTYRNNLGVNQPWSESGSFTFSPSTYHYVQGTDNQSGYVNPFVWFYINNSVPMGGTVWLLNTRMNVVSTDAAFPIGLSSTGYARSILAEGNGSYQRQDAYGTFAANYQWKAEFDPSTGFILGYSYVETDSDLAGDGFTWTDTLTDTQTSFAVTPTSGPSAPPFLSTMEIVVLAVGVTILVLAVVAIALAYRRRRRATSLGGALPRHPVSTVPPPPGAGWTPPPIDLIPHEQPTPQVVLRETVRVPCRYCGTLIDSTATVCPKCGAPRT